MLENLNKEDYRTINVTGTRVSGRIYAIVESGGVKYNVFITAFIPSRYDKIYESVKNSSKITVFNTREKIIISKLKE